MKLLLATMLLFSSVAAAQTTVNLETTIDFMNEMVKADGRQIAPVQGSKCEVTIVSWHQVDGWMLLFDPYRFLMWNDSGVQTKPVSFPRYARFNFSDIDASTIGSKSELFSDSYVKRFWDDHASVCKVVGDECKHQQSLAFDPKLSDITSVDFKTVDLKPMVQRGALTRIERSDGTDYGYGPSVSVEKMGLFFTDKDKAERFVTAFVHAIELCGGHANTFAPTPEKKGSD